jgi:glutathione S-transferase
MFALGLPILYSFRRCPYAMRARLALAANGHRCELREVLLRNKPAEMVAASSKGTVPILVDLNGEVIDESIDIMVWALRRADPQRWLPLESDTLQAQRDLIARFDGDFKFHLDRYKYPNRYLGTDARQHRRDAATFVSELERRLQSHAHLFADHPSVADMAILPFIRQFAHVDRGAFAAEPWPKVQAWLAAFEASPAFLQIMQALPAWQPGTAGLPFPPV